MTKTNKWIIALAVVLPTLLEVIDTSVVNVSLDHIRGSLSAGLDEATWSITAYLVSNAIIIPLTGWFSRFFGRKRYLMFSVALFTASSFLCGSSRTLGQLIFFRVIQGIGGGALQPLSQAILFETFAASEYGMAMAVFGVGVMIGPIIGPVLGGWITDNWSWNWIFYINIPIGLIALIMIAFFIHDPHYLKKMRQKIDFWGLGLIVVGIGCLQIFLDKGQREDWFSSAFIVRLAIISAISLIAFVIIELRTREPILNLREFKDISFTSANIIQCVAFFVLFGILVMLPLFLQQLLGYTALLAGMVLAPGGVASLLAMPCAGRLVTKINPKGLMIFGIIITIISTFIMVTFNLYVNFQLVAWSRFLMGIGLGFVFVPLASMAFVTIKKEEMGNATSIFNLLRNIAGSFGIAFMTTMLARRAQFHQFRLVEKLNPFDAEYQAGLYKTMEIMRAKTGVASTSGANTVIYKGLMQQATLFSFTDCFYLGTVILFCVIPLIFFLKRQKGESPGAIVH